MTETRTMVAKAHEAHGKPPDWVIWLAEYADRLGLRGAERQVGYAVSTLSQVISNTYPGRLDSVEKRVRAAIASETVTCPILGEIKRGTCTDWQDKARQLRTTSSQRVRMFHACKRSACIHSKFTKETAGGAV